MPADKQSLLDHYRRTREGLLAAIDSLSDAQLTERTLDGWSVKDHLAHIATWDEIRANEVQRCSSGYDAIWLPGEHDEDYNSIAYDQRKDLSITQVRWELEMSRRRLLDAISSAAPRGLDPSLYGEAGLMSGHEAQHTGWIKRWRGEKGV